MRTRLVVRLHGVEGPWCKWHTHQIDMHGDQNEWYSKHNWECGTTGKTFVIERNTVLYTRGLAIKIRGNPADKAVVDGNVFKHRSRGGAIAQNGKCGGKITNAIDVRRNNIFGVDPTKELGRCDFRGRWATGSVHDNGCDLVGEVTGYAAMALLEFDAGKAVRSSAGRF